jgi:hypothetical protein
MNSPESKKVKDLPEISRDETAAMINTNDSPDSKASDDTLILDDPDYIAPNHYDIILSDIDSPLLHGLLSTLLGARYLSEVATAEQQERFEEKSLRRVCGPESSLRDQLAVSPRESS